jgi:hypothetical protein
MLRPFFDNVQREDGCESGEERMKSPGLAISLFGLLMTSAVSRAQGSDGYPGMRGQWKGTSEAVVSGSGAHNDPMASLVSQAPAIKSSHST